jgi:hypothetical protein
MRKLEGQLVTLEFRFFQKKNGHVRITHLGMLNFIWLICFIYSCPDGLGTLGRHRSEKARPRPGAARPASCSCLARPGVVPVPGPPQQPVVLARARHGFWAGTMQPDYFRSLDFLWMNHNRWITKPNYLPTPLSFPSTPPLPPTPLRTRSPSRASLRARRSCLSTPSRGVSSLPPSLQRLCGEARRRRGSPDAAWWQRRACNGGICSGGERAATAMATAPR